MIPLVTLAEFAAIECNQCGDCCESFNIRKSPFDLATSAAQLDRWNDHALKYPRMELEAARKVYRWDMEAPILIRSSPSFDFERPWTYRCRFFERVDPDYGRCLVYEGRPPMCSEFPYGRVQSFDRCSWNVEIDLMATTGIVMG